jgi:hypothetical protein
MPGGVIEELAYLTQEFEFEFEWYSGQFSVLPPVISQYVEIDQHFAISELDGHCFPMFHYIISSSGCAALIRRTLGVMRKAR